jgi:NAD(P)H-dependent FMN reductase
MDDKPRLGSVIASTRPGRVGLTFAEWFTERARRHGAFEVEVIDLLELDLPFLDEPNHPRLHQYTKQHTKDWSARVDALDAFVFVMPEYNYGFNAPLKNAIDFLHVEWAYKPVGFVNYGGVAAGQRAASMMAQVLASLRMTPTFEGVRIPFFRQFLDDEGKVRADETLESSADAMLDELVRLEAALRPLRRP